MRFTALFVLAASIASILADVITVENDITQEIGPELNTLNNDVLGFPVSGLIGARAIRSDFQTLTATFNTAITNVKNTGAFGTVSGTAILADIQALVPTFLSTLVSIGAQAPSWSTIPSGTALVLSDLKGLNTVTLNYLDAIISAEPLLLKAGGFAIKAQLAGAFTTAIGYYSVV